MPPAASSTHEGFFAEAIVTVPSALSAIAQRWAPVPLRVNCWTLPPGRAEPPWTSRVMSRKLV